MLLTALYVFRRVCPISRALSVPLSLLLMAPAAGPPRLAKDTAPDVGPALWASREAGEQLPAPEFRHGCSWTGGCWGAWEEAAGHRAERLPPLLLRPRAGSGDRGQLHMRSWATWA